MASDIFDKIENIGAITKCTPMNRPCRSINFIVRVNRFEKRINGGLFYFDPREAGVIKLVEGATENSTLSAATRNSAL